MKKILKEWVSYFLIILAILLIRLFIITPVRVDGPSMNPTLENKQILLLSKYSKHYERFDIVVFNYAKQKLVKRIIGIPGEKIEFKNNKLYINNKEIEEEFGHMETEDFSLSDIGYETIPDNMYFLVGDNRTNSLDSRYIGLVSDSDIEGVVHFSIWPLKKIK